jgi:hypothetical protein
MRQAKVAGKKSAECLLTYMVKFDSVVNIYVREFDRQWTAHGIPAMTFREYVGENLQKYLITHYRMVATAAINELDRSSLWTSCELSLKEFFIDRRQVFV